MLTRMLNRLYSNSWIARLVIFGVFAPMIMSGCFRDDDSDGNPDNAVYYYRHSLELADGVLFYYHPSVQAEGDRHPRFGPGFYKQKVVGGWPIPDVEGELPETVDIMHPLLNVDLSVDEGVEEPHIWQPWGTHDQRTLVRVDECWIGYWGGEPRWEVILLEAGSYAHQDVLSMPQALKIDWVDCHPLFYAPKARESGNIQLHMQFNKIPAQQTGEVYPATCEMGNGEKARIMARRGDIPEGCEQYRYGGTIISMTWQD